MRTSRLVALLGTAALLWSAAAPAWAEAELAEMPELVDRPGSAAETPLAPTRTGQVTRARVTSGIEDREPVDQLTELTNENVMVFFFTELADFEGQTVTHRWMYGEQVMAEVPFTVGGNPWRVWSSKNLDESWVGKWTVAVLDEGRNVIESHDFTVTSADAPAAAEVEPAGHEAPGQDAPAAPSPGEPDEAPEG